jgi:uncharacterized protein YdhG (YjbR/CyaY superfamily)
MQYKVSTPEEYFNALEKDWKQEKLMLLRDIILKESPEIVEGISYKMLSYADEKGIVFHLNAQRNYVSLYVGNASKVDPEGELLKGLDVGKGCIRFNKSVSVSESRIDVFIKKAIHLWKEHTDIAC